MPARPARRRAAAGSGDGVLRAEKAPSIASVHAEWTALAHACGNVFGTPEFVSTSLGALGEGATPLLVILRRPDGEAAGILPLAVQTEKGLRVARFLGQGPGDRLAPVCAPEDRKAVARAMRAYLRKSSCDLFLGEQVPAEEGWAEALGASVVGTEANPVLATEGLSWEDFLARRTANFRQQVRKRERRLEKLGELSYRLTSAPGELERDMRTLFELHDARWDEPGMSSFIGRTREVHRQFAAVAQERGWLRLWFLEIDGRPLAAWYGFRYGDTEWAFQTGRDPDAERNAVGFVLYAHTIREAMNDGMREYRLLRGDESYKARFSDGDPGLVDIALPLSARGRAALLAMRARPVAGRALRSLRARARSGGDTPD